MEMVSMEIRINTVILGTILTLPFTSTIIQHTQPSQHPIADVVVTVTDKAGGLVTGLTPNDFEVSVDKGSARVVSLSNADSPVSVGILLDSSGSMNQGSNLDTTSNFFALREALRHFLRSSNPANDYFLIGFNIKPQLLSDWTSDPATIIKNFDRLNVDGDTALYDACYLALDKLNSGRHAKRALILLSDGQDNYSKFTFKELRELLRESGVLLYSIYFQDHHDAGSTLGMEGAGVLQELSFLSGGKVFSDKDGTPLKLKDANPVFEIIAAELRNQYSLTIVPGEPMATRKWHKIKVKVNLSPKTQPKVKGLTVRVKEGFYAH
jgi:Ca-activated chloride channel family protein